jgi:hypothetical protein
VSRRASALLLVLGLVGHGLLQAAPAWKKVHGGGGGRDFASYYYAADVALRGGDPYENPSLDAAAREDHTRKSVNPYFYPPPFLLTVGWIGSFSLQSAYELWFFVNEALLFAALGLGVLAFGVPVWAVAALLWTWSPIPDNAWMGQANLLALVPALAGLAVARKRPAVGGVLVGTAAMLKMSPALFLGWWVVQRNGRAVAAACATAVGLSLAALPLVGVAPTLRFYTEVLPGFSKGDYHGLKVPISLEANHSVPDLMDRLFPGPGSILSPAAQHASTAIILTLLAVWAWRAWRATEPAAILGALTVLMVATPVYTYEHHLVFLLVAMGSAAGLTAPRVRTAWAAGRRGEAAAWAFTLGFAWFTLAWPLPALRAVQALLPAGLGWVCRESKTMGEATLFGLLMVLAGRAPRGAPPAA